MWASAGRISFQGDDYAMSRRRSFVFDFFPQDFLGGVVGLPDDVVGVYVKLIALMHVYEGPLPPRTTRMARAEFDDWVRDKLGHKNIRTWLKAKRVLLADPDKLVELPDGRIINPRVARDLEARRPRGEGQGGGEKGGSGPKDGQGALPFRVVDSPVDNPVEPPGKAAASGDDRPNIGQSSADVRPIRARKSLILPESRYLYPYPVSRIPHEVVVAESRFRARARGDPLPAPP